DRPGTAAPGTPPPRLELLDDVVAVHRLLGQQRGKRGPDGSPPGPASRPRRWSEPAGSEGAVPPPERPVRPLVMVPLVPVTCLVHVVSSRRTMARQSVAIYRNPSCQEWCRRAPRRLPR